MDIPTDDDTDIELNLFGEVSSDDESAVAEVVEKKKRIRKKKKSDRFYSSGMQRLWTRHMKSVLHLRTKHF